jgi:hypothetical protein
MDLYSFTIQIVILMIKGEGVIQCSNFVKSIETNQFVAEPGADIAFRIYRPRSNTFPAMGRACIYSGLVACESSWYHGVVFHPIDYHGSGIMYRR